MAKGSPFRVLDPIIPAASRSSFKQSFLHVARRLDPANKHWTNFDKPILLIGSSRGGTTLLSNIVGAHPDVLIFHEKFSIGKESHRETFGATREAASLRRSFLQFIPHRVKKYDRHWGVKIVAHFWTREDLNRFIEAFPRLKIVYVIRDGRDVVLSLMKRSHLLKSPEECVERWLHSIAVFDELRVRVRDNLMWYHYEALVANPEPQVRAICDFLRIPFYPSMLDHRTWPQLGSYEIAPISQDMTGKWKHQELPTLPPELQTRFHSVLKHLGYESVTDDRIVATAPSST